MAELGEHLERPGASGARSWSIVNALLIAGLLLFAVAGFVIWGADLL